MSILPSAMDGLKTLDVCSLFLQVEMTEGADLVHVENETAKGLRTAENFSPNRLLLDKRGNTKLRRLKMNRDLKKTKAASEDADVDVCSMFLKVELKEGTAQVKTETDDPIATVEHKNKIRKRLPSTLRSQSKTGNNTTESNNVSFAELPSPVKSHVCQVCNRNFKKRGGLNEHMLIHTGERPQKCHICTKSFRLKSNLSRHLLTHTGLKPHFCTICNRKFTQKSDLMVHLSVHTGERPYSCRICNKSFTQQGSLSRHGQVHTDLRPHECHLCLKRFRKKCSLLNHLLIHTNEKPFTCDYCVKTFTQKSGLLSHILRHTGQKPYVCPTCNKGFVTNGILTRHMLVHSQTEDQ